MQLVEIKFHNDILEVVEDGTRWINVNKICQNLGIDRRRQQKKLQSDPTYEARLIEVPTAGGVQKVFCIPLEKLNGWLFTINPNKVKPEVKQKLIAYKNECFKVLYNHFLAKASGEVTKKIAGYRGVIAKLNKEIEQLKDENKKMEAWIERMEQRRVKCSELKDVLGKGLKYDELYARHLKLLDEYDKLRAKVDGLRQCYLPNAKKIVEFFEGGEL